MNVKKALISQSTFDNIKEHLKEMLPNVKPTLLVEAIARGLGWSSYYLLRNEFKELGRRKMRGRVECQFDDEAFELFLRAEGIEVERYTLSRSFFENPVVNTTFSVLILGRFRQAHAPYLMSLPLYNGEPSNAMSPEALKELNLKLNGGKDPSDYFDDPNHPFCEVHKKFLKTIPKIDLEGEEFIRRIISDAKKKTP